MAFLRTVWTLLKLLLGLGLTFLAVALSVAATEQAAGRELVPWVAIAVGLVSLWLFVIRPLRRRRRGPGAATAGGVPASVVGIERVPPPGAPWYYWTYVTFDSRGTRLKLHLSKKQARRMFDTLGVGDVGHLEHAGDRLIGWEPASATRPVTSGGASKSPAEAPSLFLSYAHEWEDDARYLAEFFRSRGFAVWFDEQSLRFGDKLREQVLDSVRRATFFMPLLSAEYWTSEWCIEEMETAAAAGCRVIPLKVSDRELVPPPHLRKLYRETLGDPAYLDLRSRNPVPKLEELVRQMRA